jgi:hypothetical protein
MGSLQNDDHRGELFGSNEDNAANTCTGRTNSADTPFGPPRPTGTVPQERLERLKQSGDSDDNNDADTCTGRTNSADPPFGPPRPTGTVPQEQLERLKRLRRFK